MEFWEIFINICCVIIGLGIGLLGRDASRSLSIMQVITAAVLVLSLGLALLKGD